ncbi:hypothetical protein VHEMI09864 [[Torrubiella] hemipterigena]|uniref:beta-N-acetylhexosaminidase n=1 Tax=[Torrubiella] hemipterigena TaxID=1531966 RepID=A0A0A1TQU6_9HYPO|nr:hypothetical protein VHEMI09864 [[Torrubiella] hemipterigena]
MSLIPQPRLVTLTDGCVELATLESIKSEIDSTLPREGYTIDISEESGVTLRGGSEAGLFYARQTLRQLLPARALRKAGNGTKGPWKLQTQHISDSPSSGFSWRGCMLDVARHFMPVPDILRFIDLMAFHKLNVLHLHLTDDQGWRIDVPDYPKLTSVGGWRSRTMQGARQHGLYDGRPHGGFYSEDDLHEIVAFAAERHITVVPEVNMPGHMQAAIAAYPELGNVDVPGRDQAIGVRDWWGISKHVLNVSNPTLDFCRSVLTYVCRVFPSEMIGIGGDECPYDEWKESQAAQARMKELGLTQEPQLQGWFTKQLTDHLEKLGRRALAWDEAMTGYSGSVGSLLITAWRGPGPTAVAARRGFDVVACPDIDSYFDYRQSEDAGEPTPMECLLTLEDVYNTNHIPAGLTPEEAAHIIGAQVTVFTENMESIRRVEYMAFPRLCAFAEVAWGRGSNDFEGFRKRLEQGHIARLEALGVNYRPLAGPRPWDGKPDAPGKVQSRAERLAQIEKVAAEFANL